MNDLILISVSKHELKGIIETSLTRVLNENNYFPSQKLNSEHPEIFGIKKASEFLGIAVPTIYTKTSKGEIPHFKRGKRLWFKKSDLIQWIEDGRRKTVSEESRELADYLKNKENR